MDFNIHVLSNGVEVVNTTPHDLTFGFPDGHTETVAPCGLVLNATVSETYLYTEGPIKYVETVFKGEDRGFSFLQEVNKMELLGEARVIVGSMIAAQAYGRCGFPVAVVIPVEGYERLPPAQKRMQPDKFTIYPETV